MILSTLAPKHSITMVYHKVFSYKWLVVMLLLSTFHLFSQELPLIEVYTPKDYGAENQNWGISQSKDRNIYIANSKGLLEFNGADWTLYPSPNETIIRSVNVIDDLIYTGCYKEFGFWKRNDYGTLNYTSISQKIQIPFLEDEEIWNIISIDEWVLFQSLKRIYVYNVEASSFSIIDSNNTIYKIFKVSDGIYFQKTKEGIFKIEKGNSVLVSNDKIVRENLLVNIFYQNGKLLLETEDNGFYTLNDNKLEKWNIAANELLSKVSVYRSIQLKDNSFILGTISDGMLHVLPNGDIDYQINESNGLSNNTVQAIFEDIDKNIWLGLNNGINCVNADSPFMVYNEKNGKLGTVYASKIFNNILYVGTNRGLFYKAYNSKEDFTFIEGTQGQVWSLVAYDNTLFCGHNTGTFIIANGKAILISDVQGTWNFIPVKNHDDLLLQGNYDGLYILEKLDGNWKFRNKIEGFDMSSKFFEMPEKDEIIVSHEYKGVFKIKVNKSFTKALEVVKDTSIDKGASSSLIQYNNGIYYSYKEGVFKYKPQEQKFVKDTVLSNLIIKEEFSSGKLVYDKETNTLWSFSANDINYMAPGKFNNVPKVNKIPYPESLSRGLTGYENISHLENNKFLIGTDLGFQVVNLNKVKEKPYSIYINSIIVSDLNAISKPVKTVENGVFKNRNNSIEFTFSVPEFNKYLDTEYQYQLVGIDDHWSVWSKNGNASFKYLPFGDYEFNVKAKVGNTVSNNIASYGFQIERPWLLSNVMIGVYLVLLWLVFFIIHNIYKRYYRKQREKLLYHTKQELELKELENQKQLMKFNNDKLRQDIENKTRELGISTMSLIKKNDFLNNVKNEIKNIEDIKNLKQVVKIIDRNINNLDDWNLFEEAFNNADKDFLKRIKNDHPTLTPNDLKLCAYLRLNLSSKEIAPLLNISPRSVEVKRYRLRKKLGLMHEAGLTDYILEF